LQRAKGFTDPLVDIRPYMVSPPAGGSDADYQVPLCLVYFLNIFTKYILAAFISNGGSPKNNSTVGAAVVYVFGDPQLMLGGSVPMIDILLAKMHKVCPVLFGITGDDTTKAGRVRLGWGRTEPGGPFVDIQTQGDRNIGLGTGWASMTLRDLNATAMKNGRKNPLPPRMFWASAASILNTPPDQLTKCHLEVLRSMLEFSVDRFVLFYGHAAVALLRRAAIDLPKMVQESSASNALGMLGAILNKEANFTL
jgi:nucleoporin GLE1